MVVGITGSKAPITPSATINQPMQNHSQRITSLPSWWLLVRPPASGEFLLDVATHRAERSIGAFDGGRFLRFGHADAI